MIKPLIYGAILVLFVIETANVPPLSAPTVTALQHASITR